MRQHAITSDTHQWFLGVPFFASSLVLQLATWHRNSFYRYSVLSKTFLFKTLPPHCSLDCALPCAHTCAHTELTQRCECANSATDITRSHAQGQQFMHSVSTSSWADKTRRRAHTAAQKIVPLNHALRRPWLIVVQPTRAQPVEYLCWARLPLDAAQDRQVALRSHVARR